MSVNDSHEIFVSLPGRRGEGTTYVTTECLSSSVGMGCATVLGGVQFVSGTARACYLWRRLGEGGG